MRRAELRERPYRVEARWDGRPLPRLPRGCSALRVRGQVCQVNGCNVLLVSSVLCLYFLSILSGSLRPSFGVYWACIAARVCADVPRCQARTCSLVVSAHRQYLRLSPPSTSRINLCLLEHDCLPCGGVVIVVCLPCDCRLPYALGMFISRWFAFLCVPSCLLGIGITLSSCGSAVGTTTQRGFLHYPVLYLLHSELCYKSCNGASFSLTSESGHGWPLVVCTFLGCTILHIDMFGRS